MRKARVLAWVCSLLQARLGKQKIQNGSEETYPEASSRKLEGELQEQEENLQRLRRQHATDAVPLLHVCRIFHARAPSACFVFGFQIGLRRMAQLPRRGFKNCGGNPSQKNLGMNRASQLANHRSCFFLHAEAEEREREACHRHEQVGGLVTAPGKVASTLCRLPKNWQRPSAESESS